MSRAEAILDRMHALYPKLIDLSLDRIRVLLGKLGNPERHLPPVIHVAGTNGKGSTCAFLRAIAEAAGWKVHVTTSPHLVSVTERFRVAGALVDEDALAATLDEIERVNDGAPITVFEVLCVAAFVLFARTPAALCILETGLGGRLDATNVVAHPASCAITSISLDHQDFLGDTVEAIAAEKAGIIKPGAPVVTGAQPASVMAVLDTAARHVGTRLLARGRDWHIAQTGSGLRFEDERGSLDLPLPSLTGEFQLDNAGIAVAALRASSLDLPDLAYAGIGRAEWPGRLQRLTGTLASRVPGFDLFLDGGHNPGAGQALARQLDAWGDRPLYLVIGMKQAKDAAGFLAPLLPLADAVFAVAEPGQHLALPVEAIIAASGGIALPGPMVEDALRAIAPYPPGRILICGSLYLAGEVLKLDRAPALLHV